MGLADQPRHRTHIHFYANVSQNISLSYLDINIDKDTFLKNIGFSDTYRFPVVACRLLLDKGRSRGRSPHNNDTGYPMGIFSRLTDIVNSNISALLDRAEDPVKMIRLIIQEMEDTLVEVRADAARLIADRKEIKRRLQRLADGQMEWQKRAELAVQKGREDLARAALIERAKLGDLIQTLEDDYATLQERTGHLDDDIARLQTKLAEAKAKQAGLMARAQTANARLSVRGHLYDGRVDNAMSRFDLVERKLDEMEGRVEAFDLGKGAKTLADEIADLEATTQIDNELAKLKAHLGMAAKPEPQDQK